jgi:hypothetical protein
MITSMILSLVMRRSWRHPKAIYGSCPVRSTRITTICHPGYGLSLSRPQLLTTGGGLKRAMPHASPASQVGLARWMIGCGVGRRAGGTGSLSLKQPT